MTKHTVVFQARITYEVNTRLPSAAVQKAYMEMIESLPCVDDESEDGRVICTNLELDQILKMEEVNEKT